MELKVTPRQQAFLQAKADEVLFGGAAGGCMRCSMRAAAN